MTKGEGLNYQQYLEINFGKSIFAKKSPFSSPSEESDIVITVPRTAILPQLKVSEEQLKFKDPQARANVTIVKPEKSNRSFTVAEYPLVKSSQWDYERKIMMFWILERNEWVGLEYYRWQEDSRRQDESYSGPFAIDNYSRLKLLQAFDVPVHSHDVVLKMHLGQSLKDIKKLDPYVLKNIGDSEQSKTFSIAGWDSQLNKVAADWDSNRGKWTVSEKKYLSVSWAPEGDLLTARDQELAYSFLLQSFGLKPINFPLAKINKLSPRQLSEFGSNDPISSSIGDVRLASEVRDVKKN